MNLVKNLCSECRYFNVISHIPLKAPKDNTAYVVEEQVKQDIENLESSVI